MICPRCHRTHSGVCGIPGIGVRIATGIGSRPITRGHSTDTFPIKAKPSKETRTKEHLEHLLSYAQDKEEKCLEMIKHLSPEMKEYNDLLERLDKLKNVLTQIRIQLVSSKS